MLWKKGGTLTPTRFSHLNSNPPICERDPKPEILHQDLQGSRVRARVSLQRCVMYPFICFFFFWGGGLRDKGGDQAHTFIVQNASAEP